MEGSHSLVVLSHDTVLEVVHDVRLLSRSQRIEGRLWPLHRVSDLDVIILHHIGQGFNVQLLVLLMDSQVELLHPGLQLVLCFVVQLQRFQCLQVL